MENNYAGTHFASPCTPIYPQLFNLIRYVLHSAIFQIVANNFLEVLLRSYWHVAGFVILTKSNKSESKVSCCSFAAGAAF